MRIWNLLKILDLNAKLGRLGFEPRTNRLKAECSTAELATRIDFCGKHFLMSCPVNKSST